VTSQKSKYDSPAYKYWVKRKRESYLAMKGGANQRNNNCHFVMKELQKNFGRGLADQKL